MCDGSSTTRSNATHIQSSVDDGDPRSCAAPRAGVTEGSQRRTVIERLGGIDAVAKKNRQFAISGLSRPPRRNERKKEGCCCRDGASNAGSGSPVSCARQRFTKPPRNDGRFAAAGSYLRGRGSIVPRRTTGHGADALPMFRPCRHHYGTREDRRLLCGRFRSRCDSSDHPVSAWDGGSRQGKR